ncbi:Atxe2 family lasso peptide isopeptidase [Brevundimonas sp.]|uniref:Atxe2 family lasso peptide isopeptidase n=1 Tax=Brevundimonas sp. TaxID=1871086 RepID=UPI00289E0EAC|nr:Atxe2 family lasso peptide isopeptidase [Brevundimonas sp.]
MTRCLLFCVASVALSVSSTALATQVAPVAPQRLVETSDISAVAISPDNRSLVFRVEHASVADNKYQSEWYVSDILGDRLPLLIAHGGEPLQTSDSRSELEIPQWSSDSRWIYYRALFDGEIQVWRAPIDGGGAEQITQDPANIIRFQLKTDGTLLFEVGATRDEIEKAELAEYKSGILIDGHIHGSQNLYRSFPIDGRLASHRQSNRGEQTLLSARPRTVKTVDLGSGAVSVVAPEAAGSFSETAPGPISWFRFRDSISVSANGMRTARLSGPYQRPVLQIEPGSPGGRTIICEACRTLVVENITWRGDEEVIFTVRDMAQGYHHSLYAWSPDRNEVRKIIQSEGLLSGDQGFGGSTCAAGLVFAACVAASAIEPPRLERIDLETGERTVLFDPNKALADSVRKSVEVQFLSWTDDKGTPFTGYLITPSERQDGERLPLFINYYLCAGFLRGGGMGDEWPIISMAGNRMAALCVNKAPMHETDALADYESGLSGVRTIIGILDQRGVVDPARVGMGGLSFGSEVTTWVSTHSNLLQAASVVSTTVSPSWFWFRSLLDGFSVNALRRWGVGMPEDTPEQWKRLSPVYYADQFQNPMLMQMVEGEYRSAIEQYVRMKSAGVPVELWVYADEFHIKRRPTSKLSVYVRNLDWFRYWLQGYVDPDARKAEQYSRWMGLRALRDERTASGFRHGEGSPGTAP